MQARCASMLNITDQVFCTILVIACQAIQYLTRALKQSLEELN